MPAPVHGWCCGVELRRIERNVVECEHGCAVVVLTVALGSADATSSHRASSAGGISRARLQLFSSMVISRDDVTYSRSIKWRNTILLEFLHPLWVLSCLGARRPKVELFRPNDDGATRVSDGDWSMKHCLDPGTGPSNPGPAGLLRFRNVQTQRPYVAHPRAWHCALLPETRGPTLTAAPGADVRRRRRRAFAAATLSCISQGRDRCDGPKAGNCATRRTVAVLRFERHSECIRCEMGKVRYTPAKPEPLRSAPETCGVAGEHADESATVPCCRRASSRKKSCACCATFGVFVAWDDGVVGRWKIVAAQWSAPLLRVGCDWRVNGRVVCPPLEFAESRWLGRIS